MAETHSYPEDIRDLLPNLDVQCEDRFKDSDLTDITHVVVHLSDIVIKNIMNVNADISHKYDTEDYLEIIGKTLSVVFFGNETQLEWLGTERLGRRKFIAFTNVGKKEPGSQNLSDRNQKVVEVMFMRTNPREIQKAFWRPARDFVFHKVLARAEKEETVRVRVMRTL
ncbi:uncharacterized protein PGRI_026920 [Penicillium griseofulvum]|uniref:Uncharacterized protein n=1 Tax=Penicillium patulum TaxID=5078 RepID=A0A135LIM4_PENPA|nr:uncharacterized protein PGRI_026920 [Penicillium griseofulvum]KXG48822.1 hypothetical protein PGRI_026920 [Penicillium griseofulvum]